ncbi:unnamed protein product [Adineta ricciae]|uniref:Uncharacterized protein n=1 Tax=Adineta ricciae TaxID=249248 RepID=A0A815GJI2_ADIRI|nr:unnamed protein product [Adineta ricciae]
MNYMILILSSLIILVYKTNGTYADPVPPQPSQYTTSLLVNGQRTKYYVDTTLFRDRLDYDGQTFSTIIDFETYRYYKLSQDTCSWGQIPGKIEPMLTFRTYEFKGSVTYNNISCYKWSGCHNYEIPPAPFYYYATVKENLPMDLNLYTVGSDIQFFNFTYGPPPSNVFDIPKNCTQTEFDLSIHPTLLYEIHYFLKKMHSGRPIIVLSEQEKDLIRLEFHKLVQEKVYPT